MLHFVDHAHNGRRCLMLNNFIHLGQTKCIKGTFLVFRSSDTALYLLNFYSCHSLSLLIH